MSATAFRVSLLRASALFGLLCLGLPGCMSSRTFGGQASTECLPVHAPRTFGRRFERFFGMAGRLDDAVAHDVRRRSKLFAEDVGTVAHQFGRDASNTGKSIARFGPAVAGSVRKRGPQLGEFFVLKANRTMQDSRCFFARAWHSLKMLE